MTEKKIILVTGATGAQGKSVARSLLQNGSFAVRIFTRNAASANALALQALGAEVAEGDMNDLDSLERAMDGCYGVFGITNYWKYRKREYTLGMNLIEAVAISGISHFVFHSMPGCKSLMGGEPQRDCDSTTALKTFCQDLRLPATFIDVGLYYEHFLTCFRPSPDPFGTVQFRLPQGHTRLPMVSAEDVGPIVARVFSEPETFIGRTITAVASDETCYSYARAINRVLGLPVLHTGHTCEHNTASGAAIPYDPARLFEEQRLHKPRRQRELEESYSLNPAMQPFECWLEKNKDGLLSQMEGRFVDDGVY